MTELIVLGKKKTVLKLEVNKLLNRCFDLLTCKLAHYGGYFKALNDFIILILSVRFMAFSKG